MSLGGHCHRAMSMRSKERGLNPMRTPASSNDAHTEEKATEATVAAGDGARIAIDPLKRFTYNKAVAGQGRKSSEKRSRMAKRASEGNGVVELDTREREILRLLWRGGRLSRWELHRQTG